MSDWARSLTHEEFQRWWQETFTEHHRRVEKELERLIERGYLIDELKIVHQFDPPDGYTEPTAIGTTIVHVPSNKQLTTLN